MDSKLPAVLALEDGSVFRGEGFGARTEVSGEVVFNTSMIGYPELLTDPSYLEQIVLMTYPIIGSYGVPALTRRDKHGVPLDFESDSVKVKGYGVHSLSSPSHWSSERTISNWLEEQKVPGIAQLDTRALTRRIRTEGTMLGFLQVSDKPLDRSELDAKIKKLTDPNTLDLVRNVTVAEPVHYPNNSDHTVVVIDCGAKYGIIRSLLSSGVSVVRVPYDYSLNDILEFEPSGVVISNGPGDPKNCKSTIETARKLMETDLPLFGICLGMQILALAAGGDTFKLKFGHRAVNHPCLDLVSGRCYITTQNHGYSVSPVTINETDLQVRFVNANDRTIEGIQHKKKKILGVQWHPESSPGPYDTQFLFDNFGKDSWAI